MPPSEQRLRLVASSPERLIVRLQLGSSQEYKVPIDGRLRLEVPAYRRGCSVYLFDQIRIRRGADPFPAKTITILDGGMAARRLSLKDISALLVDSDGYRLLTLGNKRQ